MNEEETRTIKYLNNSRQMYRLRHVGKTDTQRVSLRSKMRRRRAGENTVREAVSTLVCKINQGMEKSVRLIVKKCRGMERNSVGTLQIP